MNLQGKVALVTGAGRGMGRAHALALARAGAAVVVNDLGGSIMGDGADQGPASDVVAEICAAGGKATASFDNVALWGSGDAIVQTALDAYGALDIVVNNAGISRFAALGEMDEDNWDLPLDVILKGTVAIANAAARHWHATGPTKGRALVNVSSPAGQHPMPGGAAYCSAKAGVAAFTQGAALELAPLGVRVNAISPVARTRMIDVAPEMLALMQPGESFDPFLPEHAAVLVAYLAGPTCRFTGRLFGLCGDEVFLYDEWSASGLINNGQRAWTVETLAAAMADVPLSSQRWSQLPVGGRIMAFSPPAEVLAMLE